MKRWIAILCAVFGLLLFSISDNVASVKLDKEENDRSNATLSLIEPDNKIVDKNERSEYAPNEILVKFKEGVNPQTVLQAIGLEIKSVERIHSIRPVASKFKKTCRLEKDENDWYPFLGKNYREIDEIPDEVVFNEAYKGMPEAEKSIYRSYMVTLPEGTDVLQAVQRLKKDPGIEYAEPNYIRKTMMVPNDPTRRAEAGGSLTTISGA